MHPNRQEALPMTGTDGNIPIVETLARWVKKKHLETPATFILEMHRPLMPLAYPAAMLIGPFVAPFFGPEYYEKVEALRDPAVFDRLLERIASREPNGPERTATPDVHT
jgi:hypothetical protein